MGPRRFKKILHPAYADDLERDLLCREVVVQARLPDAENVGDILGRRAVIAARGENAGGGVDDLGRTAMSLSPAVAAGARRRDRFHWPFAAVRWLPPLPRVSQII